MVSCTIFNNKKPVFWPPKHWKKINKMACWANFSVLPFSGDFQDVISVSSAPTVYKWVAMMSFCWFVNTHEDNHVEPLNLVGSYVVVADDSKLWVGFVNHRCKQFGDYFIRFLHPAGINASYSFPDNRREESFKEQSQIKGVLPVPTLSGRSSRENLNSLMSD